MHYIYPSRTTYMAKRLSFAPGIPKGRLEQCFERIGELRERLHRYMTQSPGQALLEKLAKDTTDAYEHCIFNPLACTYINISTSQGLYQRMNVTLQQIITDAYALAGLQTEFHAWLQKITISKDTMRERQARAKEAAQFRL